MPRNFDIKICKPCITNGTKNGWTSWDDEALAEGKIFCPALKTLVSIVDVDVCKYQLEYMMLDQKKL